MGRKLEAVIFLCFLDAVQVSRSHRPEVQTSNGRIRGARVSPSFDPSLSCNVFHQIPFAQPPIAELRLEKPRPYLKKWDEVLDGEKPGPECIQMPQSQWFDTAFPQSEDCLHLSILQPPSMTSSTKGDENMAVLVWIHGGGFVVGSGPLVHPMEEACGILGVHDVILVVVQYRLGYLGFLSTGDDAAPGNLGIWDQIEALRWVQKNIESFGGDPNRVTIFGESAGGSSVSLLSYIPIAQPLFRSAWALSGSAHAHWVTGEQAVARTGQLASELSCQGSSHQIVQCIRSKTVQELNAANKKLFGQALFQAHPPLGGVAKGGGYNVFPSLEFGWNPRIDGDLFPASLERLGKEVQAKPFVTGSTEWETIRTLVPTPDIKQLLSLEKPFIIEEEDVEEERVKEAIHSAIRLLYPQARMDREAMKTLEELAKTIYLDSDWYVSGNKSLLVWALVRLTSDVWIDVPTIQDAAVKKKAGGEVWVYSLEHFRENNYPADWKYKGTQHAEDVFMLFGRISMKGFPAEALTENDRLVRHHFSSAIAEFAKTGDPSPKNFKWSEFESLQRPRHLIFRPNLTLSTNFRGPSVPFWTLTAPSLLADPIYSSSHQEL